MCGIAGVQSITFLSSEGLSKALISISHRGPDDSGVYKDSHSGVGLVHTRLSILDLSPLGHQPMSSDDGSVVIVFNGEIYNFRELRAELEFLGCTFHGNSDTEVLLNLYLAHRKGMNGLEKMLKKINGIFAFAIWDADLGALCLARDALGVKPLYYSSSDYGFLFSSEIKALTALLSAYDEDFELLSQIDCSAIDRYLTYLWCPGSQTPSKNVKKLLPGQAIWVKEGKLVDLINWYQLPAFRLTVHDKIKRSEMREADAIHATEHHLSQAVKRQLVADVPVGAFLSGGLDSSSIVAFARKENPNIRCFTIDTSGHHDEGFADDLPYAKKVASHLNVPLDIVKVDPIRMAMDLPSMIAQLDEPLADPAPLNVLYISELARQQGIKVLLSGAGGDDLFSGYRRHFALSLEKYWRWLPFATRALLATGSRSLNAEHPLGRRLRKLFNGAELSGDQRLINYFRWIDRQDLHDLYTPEFLSELGKSRPEDIFLEFLSALPPDTDRLERMLALEQRFFLADHNLTYTDKMSMAVGVEVRVPFLDIDLVEFAALIPPHFKQKGRVGKWILKKTMEPYLPHDIIYRPKSGFGAPLRRWLRNELREWLADTLSPQSLNARGLFDATAVHRLIKANSTGTVDATYTLFSLACIEIWCQNNNVKR